MNWSENLLSRIASVYVPFVFNLPGTINVGDSFYDETADFYSSLFASNKNDDIPMYLAFAQKTGSPVLEAACGDGRVLIPLAQNGFTVFGFDISGNLLAHCLRKVRKLKPDEQTRIHLCRSSLQNVPFKAAFKLALIPYNSFNHLLTEDDQQSCLNGLYHVLKRDGLLVMEVLSFHRYYFTGIRVRRSGVLSDNNSRVTAYSKVIQDIPNNSHTVYWYIYIKNAPETFGAKRIISQFTRKDIPLKQIERLVTGAGFTIEEIRYAYSKHDEIQDKRIVIARKS